MSEPEGKKEPKFLKIEGGMIYIDDKGETIAVGLPTKVREVIGGKAGAKLKILNGFGGEISGEKVSEIEYDWMFVADQKMDPETVATSTNVITSTSKTVAASASTAITLPPFVHYEWVDCPNCGESIVDGSKFCNHCGAVIS